MKTQRFADLLRCLIVGISRRSLLAGLAAGMMGLPPGALGPKAVAKKHHKRKRKHRSCKKNCASKTCGPDGCGGRCGACGMGAGCVDGTCLCLEGFRSCQGGCIPASLCCLDANCPAGTNQTCQAGICACALGQQDSGGVCGAEPSCLGNGALCGLNNECCSAECIGSIACNCSEANQPCHTTADCCLPLTCRGFVCAA
jgi:hypothetical protein